VHVMVNTLKQKVYSHIIIKQFKKKVSPPPCPKRKSFMRYCERRGALRGEFKNCVFDLCAGISKRNERRIVKIDKKEDKKPLPVKKLVIPVRRRVTCSAEGDPHFTLFTGKKMDFQGVGDWVLYKGPQLQIHYRGASWFGFPRVQIKLAARVRNDVIISTGQDLGRLKVNNQIVHLPENTRFTLPSGGFLVKSGNKLTITSNTDEEADFYSYVGTTDPKRTKILLQYLC